MQPPIYIGDEIGAAGYRLAGAEVVVPAEGGEADALADALAAGGLVLLSARIAASVGERRLQQASAREGALLAIVPDARGEVPMPDLAARLRAQLGLEG